MAIQAAIGVDGGDVQFAFTAGSILAITVSAGEEQGITIAECLPTLLQLGGAANNWTEALINEAATAPGSVALQLDITTQANSSTTVAIPGAEEQHVDPSPGETTRLVFIILDPALEGGRRARGSRKVRYQVRRENLGLVGRPLKTRQAAPGTSSDGRPRF